MSEQIILLTVASVKKLALVIYLLFINCKRCLDN